MGQLVCSFFRKTRKYTYYKSHKFKIKMRKSDTIGNVQREFGKIDIYEIYPENNSKEMWNREKSQRKTIGFSESESEDRELERGNRK